MLQQLLKLQLKINDHCRNTDNNTIFADTERLIRCCIFLVIPSYFSFKTFNNDLL